MSHHKKQFHTLMDEEFIKKMKAYAEKDNRTSAQFIVAAVQERMNKMDEKEKR